MPVETVETKMGSDGRRLSKEGCARTWHVENEVPADRNHGASPLLDRSSDIVAAAAAVVEIPPTRDSSVKQYDDGDRVLLPAESQPEYRDTPSGIKRRGDEPRKSQHPALLPSSALSLLSQAL